MDSQYQGELFKDNIGPNQKPLFRLKPTNFIRLKRISLTYEVFFSLIIVFLIVVIIAYSIGVEKGKAAALKNIGVSDAKQRIKTVKVSPIEVDAQQKISVLASTPQAVNASGAAARALSSRAPEGKPRPTAADTVTQEGYYIQAASTKDKEAASGLLAKLTSAINARGYVGSGNNFFAVLIGPYKTREEALAVLYKVKQYHKDAFVKKI